MTLDSATLGVDLCVDIIYEICRGDLTKNPVVTE